MGYGMFSFMHRNERSRGASENIVHGFVASEPPKKVIPVSSNDGKGITTPSRVSSTDASIAKLMVLAD
jgi:hypothetical protein